MRALPAAKIAELASDSRYMEIEGYQDDGTGGIRKTEIVGQGGKPLATLKDDFATLVFDTCGQISSLRETAGGRELVEQTVPFARLSVEKRIFGVRRMTRNGENFVLDVTGYGHGVGMSQYGADYYARQGMTWREILAHYYPGTELTLYA